ncbi:hypothetical protein, partial [Escherichia coli]|uniref:hypothetical protein n=1 Tax=Escherichia coli TaxID=562 RepID=UPI001B8D2456
MFSPQNLIGLTLNIHKLHEHFSLLPNYRRHELNINKIIILTAWRAMLSPPRPPALQGGFNAVAQSR